MSTSERAGSAGELISFERKQSYNAIRSSQTKTWYVVKMDGKRVGAIKQSGAGWRYYPKGRREGGEWFLSLIDCKASLVTP